MVFLWFSNEFPHFPYGFLKQRIGPLQQCPAQDDDGAIDTFEDDDGTEARDVGQTLGCH